MLLTQETFELIQSQITKFSANMLLVIIPSPNRLREHYLPLVSKELKIVLVHVILKFREHCVLLESVFLDNAANFHSLSKIVNETLVSYNLSQNSVVYMTDNTAFFLLL